MDKDRIEGAAQRLGGGAKGAARDFGDDARGELARLGAARWTG